MANQEKPSVPLRLPAYFLEKVQFLISKIYVVQIHLDFQFDKALSPDRMKKALRMAMDREPLLGCRFVPRPWRAFWERMSPEELDRADVLKEAPQGEADIENAVREFLSDGLDGTRGPQLKALLHHEDQGDRLLIKVNHQVADAAGTKELGYLIADIYRELGENPDYQVLPNLGQRSLGQVFACLSAWRLIKVFFRFVSENISLTVPLKNLVFPSGLEQSGKIRFSFHRFSKQRVELLTAHARKQGATLNDLFVAGLFHAFFQVAEEKEKRKLRMVCTVDLRRYLPEKRAKALCNLSGFFVPKLAGQPGANLDQTLAEVKQYIDKCKTKDMGLSFMLVDSLLTWPLPFAAFSGLMGKVVDKTSQSKNFPPALTNLGIVEHGALDFGGFHPVHAEVLVPPTGPPFCALGLSGYKGALTLSTGYYPSAISPQSIENLFKRLDDVLPG